MGVLYYVIPFDDQVKPQMIKKGFSFADNLVFGRNPTAKEIKNLLTSFTEYKTEFNSPTLGETWQVSIESISHAERVWTLLNMTDFVDEDTPTSICFAKGWIQLIIKILSDLSKQCGTLILFPDTGENPLIITPDSQTEFGFGE